MNQHNRGNSQDMSRYGRNDEINKFNRNDKWNCTNEAAAQHIGVVHDQVANPEEVTASRNHYDHANTTPSSMGTPYSTEFVPRRPATESTRGSYSKRGTRPQYGGLIDFSQDEQLN